MTHQYTLPSEWKVTASHICTECWMKSKHKASHPQNDQACPLRLQWYFHSIPDVQHSPASVSQLVPPGSTYTPGAACTWYTFCSFPSGMCTCAVDTTLIWFASYYVQSCHAAVNGLRNCAPSFVGSSHPFATVTLPFQSIVSDIPLPLYVKCVQNVKYYILALFVSSLWWLKRLKYHCIACTCILISIVCK